MKVLHVIPSLSHVHGGPTRAMRLIEQALLARGVEVETATTDDDGPGARSGKPCGVPLQEDGVVRRYFARRLAFYKVAPGFAWWIWRHARNYDLVHIHALFSFTSVPAAWAARLLGVPYVVRPLGTLNRYGVEMRRPWLKRLSLKFIEGPILRHAAAVHFTAEAERVEAEALGIPMRGVVIPLGIEGSPSADGGIFLERFPMLRDARIALYLSRLDPKKNVEGLLRAFASCVPGMPDVRLAIAGEGAPDYVESLHRLARDLGLGERVLWTGRLDGDMKAGAFAAAQVFVLPSHSENFGIAAAEALMAGLPCVLGEGVAISGEVAAAGAGLSVSTEPQDIARALRELLADETRRAEMGERAAELARERYSLAAMGARLARLYEEIAG